MGTFYLKGPNGPVSAEGADFFKYPVPLKALHDPCVAELQEKRLLGGDEAGALEAELVLGVAGEDRCR